MRLSGRRTALSSVIQCQLKSLIAKESRAVFFFLVITYKTVNKKGWVERGNLRRVRQSITIFVKFALWYWSNINKK